MINYNPGDIVVAPFPFLDKEKGKPRPLLVISTQSFNRSHEKIIALMITTASLGAWSSDVKTSDLPACGLDFPSQVRMKCFTLDASIIKKRIGTMTKEDWLHVQTTLCETIAVI